MTIATLLLVLGTLGLVGGTIYLALCTRRAANFYRIAERAYLKLSHVSPGVHFDQWGHFVHVQVHNTGRTPATVIDMFVKPIFVRTGSTLPATPDYSRQQPEPPRRGFLVVDMSAYFVERIEISPSQVSQIVAGVLTLYVIGYVDYIDAFGQPHRGGYARRFERQSVANNLVFVTEDGYNYDDPPPTQRRVLP